MDVCAQWLFVAHTMLQAAFFHLDATDCDEAAFEYCAERAANAFRVADRHR